MIIVKLIGGLGNQLFQYALGRHLAEIHKTILKLDISGFETYKLHKYSLSAFHVQEEFASQGEVAALTAMENKGLVGSCSRLFRKRKKYSPTHIRERKYFHFDPTILKLGDNVYLDGYWQSEKYFSGISEIIRQEVSVKKPQTGKDKALAQRIHATQSTSIHIRRGDYVTNPKTKEAHGLCDLQYYMASVSQLVRRVSDPHFFVFSDEPEWARKNLMLSFPTTFVVHNDADRNFEDLRLMSQCKHHIIANSSFSWWGAWLNPHRSKIVFAPKLWYAKSTEDLPDVTPPEWIRL